MRWRDEFIPVTFTYSVGASVHGITKKKGFARNHWIDAANRRRRFRLDETHMPYRKICRCCGLTLTHSCGDNPNICRDCETLTFDDSPVVVAQQMILDLAADLEVHPMANLAPVLQAR